MSHPMTRPSILSRDERGRDRVRKAVALLALVAVSACGGDDPIVAGPTTAEAERPPFGLVTPATAAELANQPAVAVIDVRTPAEFAEGHLERATLVDFGSATFADDIAELDPDEQYLVYCHSGNRSAQAVAIMRQLGFDHVWELDGGVAAWAADGLRLVQ